MNKTWFLDQTSPLFQQGKILKIIDICSLEMGQFMYSYNHRIWPEAFLNLFQKHNEIHNFNTRNARKIILPLCRTNIRQFSVIYQAPRPFNSLPEDIVSCKVYAGFFNLFNNSGALCVHVAQVTCAGVRISSGLSCCVNRPY